MTHKAFVSSTFEDLKLHRNHVIGTLRKAGIHVDPMEDWTASHDEPKMFSQERMKDCDLCVLLVARRRGYVPEGESLSITQLEYRAAVDSKIDILVFMLADDALWFRHYDELEKDPEIGLWRTELKERKGVGFFNHEVSSIELAPALTRWIAERQESGASLTADAQSAIEERCKTELRNQTIRFAFAVALKLSYNGSWFLVRIRSSRHPDSFSPIGGVIHHHYPRIWDELNVVPDPEQTTFADGPRSDGVDLRGVVEGRCLPDLCRWYRSNPHEHEGANTALIREISEELCSIGLEELCDGLADLSLRTVRCVPELYEVYGLAYDFQYRYFTIMVPEPDLPSTISFTERLAKELGKTPDLILASTDEIMRSTTRRGDRIAPYSAYFFGTRRSPGHT
jgi:hypothetical protein